MRPNLGRQRCAIYARFSTDRQNEKSAEDQVRECRRRAEQEGWNVVEVYSDLAISGASNRRPGMMALLADAAAGAFDIVLAEDQDRIARDLEDSAAFYKRLRFADVELFTLANGRVDELQIGFKGTMDAVELRKMADKIRRGQRGALSRGRIPGGLCYGYEVVRELDERGEMIAGRRRVLPEQAAVVRRIMEEYAADRSPKAIAKELNAEGIRSARGGEWRASAIVGNRARQIGILHNPIYVGRFVYNRVTMRRDPETRNRVSRPNAGEDRLTVEMPELRIVSDELWQKVQDARSSRSAQPLVQRKRPRHLFSGLVKCGECGGGVAIFANDRLCCSRSREAGTCSHRREIRLGELQRRVLRGLESQLLSPEAVSLLVREYHLERERRSREDAKARGSSERRLRQAQAAVDRLVAAIADGGADFAELRGALTAKTQERDQARAELAEVEAPSTIALHPHIATAYRKRVQELTTGLAADELGEDAKRSIRSLVEAIYLRPVEGGGHQIEVVGSFESAIALAWGKPVPARGTHASVMLVAEDRCQRNRHRRSIMT
jgi:DNA invertase Pin-like site-specific DNA recombinase